MQVIKKGQLLTAMKKIHLEYKNNTHRAHLSSCALCLLYNKGDDAKHRGHQCRFCPMHAFYKQTHYSCMSRNCTPFTSNDGESAVEIKQVIEFYKEAIKVVKKMSAKQLNEKNGFKFLVKIDKDVFEKYHW